MGVDVEAWFGAPEVGDVVLECENSATFGRERGLSCGRIHTWVTCADGVAQRNLITSHFEKVHHDANGALRIYAAFVRTAKNTRHISGTFAKMIENIQPSDGEKGRYTCCYHGIGV